MLFWTPDSFDCKWRRVSTRYVRPQKIFIYTLSRKYQIYFSRNLKIRIKCTYRVDFIAIVALESLNNTKKNIYAFKNKILHLFVK